MIDMESDRPVIKVLPPGERFDYDTEVAAYRILDQTDEIPAPILLAHGHSGERAYLLLSRAPGRSVEDADLTVHDRLRLAHDLGRVVRRVHELPVIDGVGRLGRDWLRDSGSDAAQRHRAWGTLPEHLINQIDDYLIEPVGRAFVHADLAIEHIFVENGELTSIIDWGGAEATDPHYELPVLHLDLFGTDKRQLAAFLEGYDWQTDDFVRRAMSATLAQEFDAFELLSYTRPDLDLGRFATLDRLADELWRI